MKVSILRLGHRIFRDQRITSHCALAARALGAEEFFYTGQKDNELENSIQRVSRVWGGSFKIRHVKDYKSLLKSKSVHLTVYGIPFEKEMKKVKKCSKLMIVVGGEKVPSDVYDKATWNLSVGSQPHSEVSSLGIFLHELKGFKKFSGTRLKVIPKRRGKEVVKIR